MQILVTVTLTGDAGTMGAILGAIGTLNLDGIEVITDSESPRLTKKDVKDVPAPAEPKRRGRKPKEVAPPDEDFDTAPDEDDPVEAEEDESEEDEDLPVPARIEKTKPIKKAKKLSIEDIIAVCVEDREKAQKVMSKFKIQKIRELPETKYEDFLKALKA